MATGPYRVETSRAGAGSLTTYEIFSTGDGKIATVEDFTHAELIRDLLNHYYHGRNSLGVADNKALNSEGRLIG